MRASLDGKDQCAKLKSAYENKISSLSNQLKVMEEENTNISDRLMEMNKEISKLDDIKRLNVSLQAELDKAQKERDAARSEAAGLKEEVRLAGVKCSKVAEEHNSELKLSQDAQKEWKEELMEKEKLLGEVESKYTNELTILERIITEKDAVVVRLENEIKAQCKHFEEEVSRLKNDVLQNQDVEKEKRKVRFLKNKNKKMQLSRENLAEMFHRELTEVVKKKDILIASLQLQLKQLECQQQAPDLAAVRHKWSEGVNELEEQYKLLLHESEVHAMTRRQKDLKKIHHLEKLLLAAGVRLEGNGCCSSPCSSRDTNMLCIQ